MSKIRSFIVYLSSLLLEPVIGHSRFVSATKVMLILAAILLIAALVIIPLTSRVNKDFRLTFSTTNTENPNSSPVMLNPHLQGVDNNNQTYNITAKSATQDKTERMTLQSISADLTLNNGGWVTLTAEEGRVDRIKNTLDLEGNINIYNNEGYEFNTSQIHADIKNNYLRGDSKITGQGPMGRISGDSFAVDDKMQRIIIKGNVMLVFFPKDSE